MGNSNQDVLRVEGTLAAIPTTIRERQNGYANNTFKMAHKFAGGTTKYWTADEENMDRTGYIRITKTTEQMRLLYDSTHYAAMTVDANGQLAVAATAGVLLYESNSDGTADAGADNLIIESAGHAGLSVLVGAGNTAKLFFADDDNTGYISWKNAVVTIAPDGTDKLISAGGGYVRLNEAMADVDIAMYYDNGVAMLINGETGKITLNYLALAGTLSDVQVNWDSGVALFAQGSSGVVGVGTATVQAWKTATYESVLSFGAAGECAIAGDSDEIHVVGNAYYDVTSDRWELSAAGYASRTMWNEYGVYNYVATGSGAPASAVSWADYLHLKALGSGQGELVINEDSIEIDTRIESNGLTHAFFVDASADKVCVNTDTGLAAKLTIVQADASGASCLSLDQNDESEGCIDFVALDRGVINSNLSSTASVRVELNGTVYRIALYADA